jgi:hypothetical protein
VQLYFDESGDFGLPQDRLRLRNDEGKSLMIYRFDIGEEDRSSAHLYRPLYGLTRTE